MSNRYFSLALVPALLLLSSPGNSQAQLTVGVAGGSVRYAGDPSTTSLAFNPGLVIERRHAVFGLSGTASGASDGTRVLEGGSTLWLASRPVIGHLQADAELEAQGIVPRNDSASASALGLAELAWATSRYGIALGGGGGVGSIQGLGSVGAARARARAWAGVGEGLISLAVEPTRLAGAWYTDVSGSAEYYGDRVDATGGIRVRRAAGSTSTGGEVSLAWHFNTRFALEGTGGQYLPDPYQGLPGGRFITLGIRWTLWQPAWLSHEGVGEASSDLDQLTNQLAFNSSAGFNGGGKSRTSVPGISHGNTGGNGGGRGHKP